MANGGVTAIVPSSKLVCAVVVEWPAAHPTAPLSVAVSNDRTTIAAVGDKGQVFVMGADRSWQTLPGQPGTGPLAISADGHTIAYANVQREIEVWRMRVPSSPPIPVGSKEVQTSGKEPVHVGVDLGDDLRRKQTVSDLVGNQGGAITRQGGGAEERRSGGAEDHPASKSDGMVDLAKVTPTKTATYDMRLNRSKSNSSTIDLSDDSYANLDRFIADIPSDFSEISIVVYKAQGPSDDNSIPLLIGYSVRMYHLGKGLDRDRINLLNTGDVRATKSGFNLVELKVDNTSKDAAK